MAFIPKGTRLSLVNTHVSIYATCIPTVLETANTKLAERLKAAKSSNDQELFALSWKVDELGRLNTDGRTIYVEVNALIDALKKPSTNVIALNMARRVVTVQEKLLSFVKGVTRHRRHAATHILVTLISPSPRNVKPYAIPVSCIPYDSLTEAKARVHINDVISEMKKRNMQVAGM